MADNLSLEEFLKMKEIDVDELLTCEGLEEILLSHPRDYWFDVLAEHGLDNIFPTLEIFHSLRREWTRLSAHYTVSLKKITDEAKKYHYICKDGDGGLFMTTERCSSIEDAKQYVGDNEVLYPFIEDLYTQALEPRMIPTTSGGFVEPFFSTQSVKDI